MKNLSTACMLVMLFCANCAEAGNWLVIDMPGAFTTQARSIYGSNIVGNCDKSASSFFYNGTSWTTLNIPIAEITGISDSKVVGNNFEQPGGLLYDIASSTWVSLNMPGQEFTIPIGIDGGNIVGVYQSAGRRRGFLYNGTSWTALDSVPGNNVRELQACDVSGSNVVGWFENGFGKHGFLYNGTSWTVLNRPTQYTAHDTQAFGISGSNIVGSYKDADDRSHGFLYDGTSWTTLDMPGATSTIPYGIDGNNIVGEFYDASGSHGFLYTVPEPSTWVLLATALVAGMFILRRAHRP